MHAALYQNKRPRRLTPVLISVALVACVVIVTLVLAVSRGLLVLPCRDSDLLQATNKGLGPIYLQTDPRWRRERIGGSDETIGQVGCVVCCISMALAHHGVDMPPDKLNWRLKGTWGFTRRGWAKWDRVPMITGGQVAVRVLEETDCSLIDAALAEGNPVIVKIMIEEDVPHWVLIVDKKDDDYLIKDPLGNGISLEKLSKYESKIYSLRVVVRQPQ